MEAEGWGPAPRLPLVDAWSGVCAACGDWVPPEMVQRDICNCGYPRGRCDRFPPGPAPDAVRFSVLADRLIYVLEMDHAPIEHGEIDGSADRREPLASQARAFLESWRRLPDK